MRLSRETVRIIQQNIVIFAFGVNAVGILVTAWLWPLLAPPSWYAYAPVAAVVYHQFGSLAVLLNAMRLLWFERTTSSPVDSEHLRRPAPRQRLARTSPRPRRGTALAIASVEAGLGGLRLLAAGRLAVERFQRHRCR